VTDTIYNGLKTIVDSSNSHLGGNVYEGDPYTFSKAVWDYVVDRFSCNSVLDLGSGRGYAANYFFRKGVKVVAVDGLQLNCDTALYPTIKHDLTTGPVYCPVDLVHCQELVEHVEDQFSDNVVRSLANGKFIVMTHAVPNQDGHHHVNNQPPEYWIEKLAAYNCHPLWEDTYRIRNIAASERAVYLAETGLVFANKNR